MLDRLVRRAVLAEPHRVVRPDVDDVQAGQRGQPDGPAHVVAERQERGDVRDEPAVVGDAVGDAAHGVLADAEAEVPAGLVGAEVGFALDVGQVRLGQVRGAAEQLGQVRRQRLDGVLARVAGGHLGPGLVGREVGVPAGRQLARDPPAELGRQVRVQGGIGIEPRAPVGLQPLAVRDRVAEDGERLVGDVEGLVRVPAVRLLGEPDLVRAERRAVGLLAVVLVRAAVADVGPDGDEARPVVGARGLDGRLDGVDVVAVLDPARVPAVGIEALDDVLGEGHRRRPVELDVVVVVEDDQLAQPEVAGEARRLGRDAFLEVAVGRDDVGPVIDDGAVGLVELGRQPSLGDGHPDRVGEALAERARWSPRRRASARIPGCPGVLLPHWRNCLSSSSERS